MDWTCGLNCWTGLKIIFMLFSENSPVGLIWEHSHFPSQTLASILSLEASTIGNTDAAWKESCWLLDYICMYL